MLDHTEIITYFAIKYEGDWDKIYEAAHNHEEEYTEEDVKNAIASVKSKIVTIFDDEYPKQLIHTFKPPFVLFYYGDISIISNYKRNLSVVGSRDTTEYGVTSTVNIIRGLKDIVIVSGMARGIDTVAHHAAIDANLKTCAVLGSGIDYCYPAENEELYELLKRNYLVISEYPNMSAPNPINFPKRNRIIAGLSKGTLVGEAYEKSGTSVTMSWTISFNRDLYCIPYPITVNSLCNNYIKHGAYLVESAQDIMNQF